MSVAASLIATTMNASTPLLLAALGILVAERSGVLNLGVEGIMLMSAVCAYMATVETGSFAADSFLPLLSASPLLYFCNFCSWLKSKSTSLGLRRRNIRRRLISLYRRCLPRSGSSERSADGIWLLDQIPFFGQAFFSQHWIVYLSLLMIPAIWYFLFKTRPGLVIRAVGESPSSANALGYNVRSSVVRLWPSAAPV